MTVVYKLVGYDRKTERATVKIDIPPKHVNFAKEVARIAAEDDSMADYPLDRDQARDIAGVLGKPIDADSYDYFLEPYVQGAHRRMA